MAREQDCEAIGVDLAQSTDLYLLSRIFFEGSFMPKTEVVRKDSPSAMEDFKDTFRSAKWVSTPFIVIETADPASTMDLIANHTFEAAEDVDKVFPMIRWDVVEGFQPINDAGKEAAVKLGTTTATPGFGGRSAPAAMMKLREIADGAIVFFANAHRYLRDTDVIQALHNLRSPLAEKNRTLVLLTIPGSHIPAELTDHIFVLDEPLPTHEELRRVTVEIIEDSRNQNPDMAEITLREIQQATDALLGLTVFTAQQTIAMSLSLAGLNLARVWQRKVKIIEETPGLSVWKGGETFNDIAGYDNVKQYLRLLLQRDNPPRAIVFLDEIEKHMAGQGSESSPVKTEMVGELLTWMQNHDAEGIVFVGPSGTGKSDTAKAAGNEIGVPTIEFNFNAMQASHVGETGERLRAGLHKIEALSQRRALFIATANNIAGLPSELRRRFNKGVFFFDLPDEAGRDAIWKLYHAKYNLAGDRPIDADWSGSDIKNCCVNAFEMKIPLKKAAEFVTPEGIAAKDQLRALRQFAHGRYISASYPGPYQFDEKGTSNASTRSSRAIKLGAGR